MVVLPWLIGRRERLLVRILAFLPAGKAAVLCWRQGRRLAETQAAPLFDWVFAALAAVAALLLFRAGWSPREPLPTDGPEA